MEKRKVTKQQITKKSKGIPYRLLRAFLVVLVFIGVIYATFPLWAKFAINKLTPDTFQVNELKIGYPSFNQLTIKHIKFSVNDNKKIDAQLENLQLAYRLKEQIFTRIDADNINISVEISDNPKPSKSLEHIPLPELPFEQASIKKLNISGLLLQQLQLTDLDIKNEVDGYSLNGNLNLFQENYQLKTKAKSESAKLSKFDLNAKNGSDYLNIELEPKDQKNLNHWFWSVIANINTKKYFNIDGLEKVSINTKGNLSLLPDIKLQIYPDSKISIPLEMEPVGLDTLIAEQALELGITADLTALAEPSLLLITTKQLETIEKKHDANHNGQWYLENSNLLLDFKNPQLNLLATIKELHLSPFEDWNSINQTLHLDATNTFTTPSIKYKTNSLSAELTDISQTANWELKLKKSKLFIAQKKSDINSKKIKLNTKDAQLSLYKNKWQAESAFTINNPQPESITDIDYQVSIKTNSPLVKGSLDQKVVELNHLKTNTQITSEKVLTEYSINNINFESELSGKNIKGSININPSDKSNLSGKVTGKNTIGALDYISEEISLIAIKSQFDWSYFKDTFKVKGHAYDNNNKVPFAYQINTRTGKHQLDLSKFKLPVLTAKQWIAALDNYPKLELIAGDINLDKLSGDPLQLTFDAQAAIQELGLNYEKLNVRGFNLKQTMNSKAQLNGRSQGTIKGINLGAGIELVDITFDFIQQFNRYQINNFKGKVLSGSINIPKLDINEDKIQPFELNLNQIQLDSLLSQLDSKSLSISGKFDFKLPISLENNSQQINNGTFKALSNGTLKVKTSNGTEQNIAYQALENFHYKEFSGTIDYDKDGNYKIKLHLLGANPELYDGFPIKLDLNLKGHLPDLLYSMLITGDIAKPVMDKVNNATTDLLKK